MDLANTLCTRIHSLTPTRTGTRRSLPSSHEVAALAETLRSVLFPGYFGLCEIGSDGARAQVEASLHEARAALSQQVARAFCFTSVGHADDCAACADRAHTVVETFLSQLPEIQRTLLEDVHAAYEGDPAATGLEETVLSYPGIFAVTLQRVAHALQRLDVPLIPRMITEHAHSRTGIDIHPGAVIGARFFIDHGTGVVIGETSIIGANVRIYQGVTLGARSFPVDADGRLRKGHPRHPIIEDGVVIYAGATVLGRITVGRGSIIGGNVWLTESVAPGSVVTQSALTREVYDGGAGI